MAFKKDPAAANNSAVSLPSSKGTMGATIFLGVFLLFGIGFSSPFLWSGWLMARALTWEKTPCVIESSRVETNRDSDGDTHSVEMSYRYFFRGEEHLGDRYQFLQMSSSGRRGKERVVARYQPQTEAFCWVSPRNPNQSVIYRGPTFDMLFVLIPMVFVLIGGGGIAGVHGWLPAKWSVPGRQAWRPKGSRSASKEVQSQAERSLIRHVDPHQEHGEVRFEPGGRLGKIVILGLCVLIFGGVAVFLWREDGPVFLWIFRIGAMFAAFVVLAGFIHSVLGLWNPRVTLWLKPRSLMLGDEVSVRYQMKGRHQKLDRLKLSLQGVEEARYRRGTDTVTDTHVFLEVPLIEMSRGMILAQGSAMATLPSESMHSFEAQNNEIKWRLKVEGEIPKWPDVLEQHEIVVDLGPQQQRSFTQSSAQSSDDEAGDGYTPGGVLTRSIDWNFEQDPEKIEVRLVWYTVGKGDQDLSVVEVQEIDSVGRQGTRDVVFDLPAGPVSYSGRLIQIGWALDVIAFPSRESKRIDIVVGPGGREVRA